MDKQIISIILSVGVLLVSLFNLRFSYMNYNQTNIDLRTGHTNIDFPSSVTSLMQGKHLNASCSSFQCRFLYDKTINENEQYYVTQIFITNNGKRAHNVKVQFKCDNINLYGLLDDRNNSFEIKQLYNFSTILNFPIVDNVNFQTWHIIYKINGSFKNFTCEINSVSDESENEKKYLDIHLDKIWQI